MGIEAFGVREVADRLRLIGGRAAHPTLFAERARSIITEEEKALWDDSPWEPLKAATDKRKARQHQDPRTLRVHEVLERALTVPDAPGQMWEATGDDSWWRFGLSQQGPAYYGLFHQLGLGVPRRTILKATPRMAKRMSRAWGAYIVGRD